MIFFSDTAYPMGHPEPLDALQPATPETKRRLRGWLETVEMCGGGRGIYAAVELVARLEPEVVYLLSDGDHGERGVELVVSADLGETVVHTFGIQQRLTDRRSGVIDPAKVRGQEERNETLIRMATAHSGTFTPVVVPPQAAALEKIRPIRKNPSGSPGPAWGKRN